MFYTGPDLSDVEKEEVIDNDDPSKKCEDWRQGRRIVELDVLAEGLKACEKCGLPLQLSHAKGILTFGLGSLLKVSLIIGMETVLLSIDLCIYLYHNVRLFELYTYLNAVIPHCLMYMICNF